MELIKYLTNKKVYTNNRPLIILSGFLFGSFIMFKYYKELEIRDKLADPKAGAYYYPTLSGIWYRYALFWFMKEE